MGVEGAGNKGREREVKGGRGRRAVCSPLLCNLLPSLACCVCVCVSLALSAPFTAFLCLQWWLVQL